MIVNMALPSLQKFRVLPGMLDVGRSDSRGWKKRSFIRPSVDCVDSTTLFRQVGGERKTFRRSEAVRKFIFI